MAEYTYTVIFEPDLKEGGYVATVPVLGIATQGETLEETRAMVQEAIHSYLEGLQKARQIIPQESTDISKQVRTEHVAVQV
ncbi:MAG: type II toxin-antitoxin system HicB family antitoxin [Candidatus Andersenbacteria bacterium]